MNRNANEIKAAFNKVLTTYEQSEKNSPDAKEGLTQSLIDLCHTAYSRVDKKWDNDALRVFIGLLFDAKPTIGSDVFSDTLLEVMNVLGADFVAWMAYQAGKESASKQTA
ncbi:MAG: hypothetical protein K2O88_06735 [Paramuribaculum sp.]|nr:hypothetical protein [Paramuribaculum sp.]